MPRERGNASYSDVDADPVLWVWGASATSFGIGAARSNGHFAHARAMASQVIAAAWPMPNGEFLLPKYAFDRKNAPYLGQTAILFQLTRRPYSGCPTSDADIPLPAATAMALSIYYLLGIPLAWIGIRNLRNRST